MPPPDAAHSRTRTPASRDSSAELVRAAVAARRYFLDGLTKQRIAEQLGVSRFKVARLLDLARAEGLVRIEVTSPFGVALELGQRLREAFDLNDAWVLDTFDVAAPELRAELGRLAARMVAGTVESDDVLGIAWGQTMRALVEALPPLPPCPAVQIAGGLPSDPQEDAVALVRRLADHTGGPAYPLHAPLFVTRDRIADSLRAEPQIAATLAMFPRLTKVAVGVGAWDPETSPVAAALLPADREHLREARAVAEVCGLFLTADGTVIDGPLARRSLAVGFEQLRAGPQVFVVAGGREKAAAIRAVLGAGICANLVTDRAAAEVLLAG